MNGSKNIRLQDLGSLSERDVIRHGNDVWTYDSKSNTVEHATLSASTIQHPASGAAAAAAPAAHRFHRHRTGWPTRSSPSSGRRSTLSVDNDVRVAGRPAYDLVLTPKATDTLVGSVSIAVDAATGLPLQVQIDAAGQTTPAVSVGFTSLDLSTPDASLFAFTPPAGATVKELTKPHAHPVGPIPHSEHEAHRVGDRHGLGCRRDRHGGEQRGTRWRSSRPRRSSPN